MRKYGLALAIVMALAVVAACSEDNLEFEGDDVSRIDVSEWQGDEVVDVIDDGDFIGSLVNDLDSANTETTADLDFESPDYRLEFQDDDETLLELGYYEQVMDLGVEGRYWNRSEQLFYKVDRELRLE